MARSSRTTAARQAPARRRTKDESLPWLVPAPTLAELATGFSQALDLAKGQRPGHAARVCYIAHNLAQALDLPAQEQRASFYGALFHDAGAAVASAELCRSLNLGEDVLFRASAEKSPQYIALEIAPANATAVVEVLRVHPERSAQIVEELGFDARVQQAVASHHERWNGHGYPRALKEEAIPISGRIVAAAGLVEHLISAELNALTARRNLLASLEEHTGHTLEPRIADAACELGRSDGFWLGLHSEDLTRELADGCMEMPRERDRSPAHLEAFARVFALLADAKREHTARHSERCAEIAVRLADALGFDEGRRHQLRIATLLHDIGLLGVPARVIAKPDILSLAEMEAMRKHPTYSQMVLEAVPGLEEVAQWAGAHHERPDGKGYPEMLDDGTLPVEARIISLADTYVALTSERPYRSALSDEDAQQVLLGGAGTQLDPALVRLFCSLVSEARSSRSAPRPRRRR